MALRVMYCAALVNKDLKNNIEYEVVVMVYKNKLYTVFL